MESGGGVHGMLPTLRRRQKKSGGSSSWSKSNNNTGPVQIEATVVPEPSGLGWGSLVFPALSATLINTFAGQVVSTTLLARWKQSAGQLRASLFPRLCPRR